MAAVESRQPVGLMGWLYALPLGIDRLVTSAGGFGGVSVIHGIAAVPGHDRLWDACRDASGCNMLLLAGRHLT